MAQELARAWAAGLATGDRDAFPGLLAPDAVLHSPLTNAFVFTGRDQVVAVVHAALDLIADIRVHTVLADDSSGVVVFAGRVAGEPMEEAHLLRFGADGLVDEVTLMGRPLPALLRAMTTVPGTLADAGAMPRAAGPAARGLAPLAWLLTRVDRHLVPRLPPPSPPPPSSPR